MTDKEILQKAIEKAEKNGFDIIRFCDDNYIRLSTDRSEYAYHHVSCNNNYIKLIFNHDFAKAFWGIRLMCYDCGEYSLNPITVGSIQIGTGTCKCSRQFENNIPEWEYRLMEMVLEKEPLKYIERFL